VATVNKKELTASQYSATICWDKTTIAGMLEDKMAKKNRKGMSLLDEVLERRMLLYVLAAGATLAGVPAAQARVVFTLSDAVFGPRSRNPLDIDLNNDGTVDFLLAYSEGGTCTSNGRVCYTELRMFDARPSGSNLVLRGEIYQAALTKGQTIGRGDNFSPFGFMAGLSSSGGGGFGSWANVTNRFLGVKFQVNGQTHYGWIGFRNVKADNHAIRAVLAGWAYETDPNKAIIAGDKGLDDSATLGVIEPTSLELLALGHTGIADRQKRISAQTQG
jgi:hypothetical protein